MGNWPAIWARGAVYGRAGGELRRHWRDQNGIGLYDTNWWKSFVHARLAVAMGDRGCLSLFGKAGDAHRLFAEHLTAEYFVKTQGRGRTVDEWKIRPQQPDNHWLDCLVGSAVAASIQGAVLFGTDRAPAPPRQRQTLSEIQRQKRRERTGR